MRGREEMPKVKIGEEKRKELGILNEEGVKVKEPKLNPLADVGMYLGIESRPEGYVIVSLSVDGDTVAKKDEYKADFSKGRALEAFKLASGKFIVGFNSKAKQLKKG